MSQGRKRTKVSSKVQGIPGPASKKARVKAPMFASLKAKNIYNKHFYIKEAHDRMHDFKGKTIVSEKKVSQETLQLYNALDLLNG